MDIVLKIVTFKEDRSQHVSLITVIWKTAIQSLENGSFKTYRDTKQAETHPTVKTI